MLACSQQDVKSQINVHMMPGQKEGMRLTPLMQGMEDLGCCA